MPTPTGLIRFDDLRAQVAAGRIDAVLLAVVDGQGRLKGKEYDARFFLDKLTAPGGAAEMCAYVFATDIAMTPVDGFELTSWARGYGDLQLAADLASARRLPWLAGTAVVFADALDPDGALLPVAPRSVLRRQLELLGGLGLQVKAGLETEFVLYHGTTGTLASRGYRRMQPVTWDNRDYALDFPQTVTDYTCRLRDVLAQAGLPVEAVKTEGAPGQLEITFPYGDPEAACEGHVLFKHAARTVADRQGLAATFMAAPDNTTGSGLHLHLSLWRGEEAAFAPEPGEPLAAVTGHAVAGLLQALPQLGPLYAPNVNSYKRYADHSFAPTRMVWGFDNRSCAVRAVGHGRGAHLEVRLPGADANPYLALAAAVAAIRHGIEQELKPPQPCTGDGYLDLDAPPVPGALEEALAAFESDPLPARLLGEEVTGHYAQAARVEIGYHRRQVTDAERTRGFAQT